MQNFVTILANPSVRRLVVALLGFFTVTLNKKLGLNLDTNDLLAAAGIVATYLGQSAYTDASKVRSDALVSSAAAATATPTPAAPPGDVTGP